MAEELKMVPQSEASSSMEIEGSNLYYSLFGVVVASGLAYVAYKILMNRSNHPKSISPAHHVKNSQENRQRRGTEEILASVYSSARFQAARLRRSSCLVKALGISDKNKDFEKIADKFHTIEEVSEAVRNAGVDSSNLIFGIDFTKSNLYSGRYTFNGNSLHHLDENTPNPYQRVITILGKTLAPFDKDGIIPVFGFGDYTTEDKRVFNFNDDDSYCHGFENVLKVYNEKVPKVKLGGPTDFAPLIREAIRIVEKSGEYHILVIIGDGQVTAERRTQDAIVEASHYPLSIIMVGVGDGPWEIMEEFDDKLPKRKFDNFQFIHFESIVDNAEFPEPSFALNALMEIPDQFKQIKVQGLLGRKVSEE
ncbi:E3 ubiquitin-protein ligase RGLG5 [Holothuria leucospilota]|uniref:E3 ubiquitin-protein ligase RGLG5 n=1 Tax=Holothuria leucospilota TaxID=206669 RepID=A0A9Q1BEK7_HOLLE|nr:E3 ubiquitin-protein ligase RGLG5 [Holothuria leucospilota]